MENVFYTPGELADDPSFRAFVRNTDPAAVRRWAEWLARHPDRAADVDEAIQLVKTLDGYAPRQLTDRQLEQEINRLQQRLARQNDDLLPDSTPANASTGLRTNRWHYRVTYAAAAAAMLLLAVYAFYQLSYSDSSPARVTPAHPQISSAASKQSPALTRPQLTQTGYGQRRTIRLPDGSVVTLNAHSTLTLSPNWVDGRREVTLTGEAFFRVSKQQRAGQPVKFIVRARNVVVEVLGTQFNVSTRNRRVKVALNEGRIRLNVPTDLETARDASRTLDMLPGDLVEISEQKAVTLSSRVEVAEHSAWVMDELVFEDTPLSEVADVIRENYGYTVEFADPTLANQRLTATLPDSNLDVLLKALEKAFALSVTKQQKTIRLSKAP